MKITETKTEKELREVEETETVEKIRCDVCDHDYTLDSWDGKEFSVDPSINREAHTLAGLSQIFDAYHKTIPLHVIDDGYDGTEMSFSVPKRDFLEVVGEEITVMQERENRSNGSQKQRYIDKIGTSNFYLIDDEIHHFRYVIDIEETTDDAKHVCNDCYDVIFKS